MAAGPVCPPRPVPLQGWRGAGESSAREGARLPRSPRLGWGSAPTSPFADLQSTRLFRVGAETVFFFPSFRSTGSPQLAGLECDKFDVGCGEGADVLHAANRGCKFRPGESGVARCLGSAPARPAGPAWTPRSPPSSSTRAFRAAFLGCQQPRVPPASPGPWENLLGRLRCLRETQRPSSSLQSKRAAEGGQGAAAVPARCSKGECCQATRVTWGGVAVQKSQFK